MKRVPRITAQAAAAMVQSGDSLMIGGFGMTGNPVHLTHALAETSTGELTVIGNNLGEPGLGAGRLLRNGQIKKAIGSFFTSNPEAVEAVQEGRVEVLLLPQGSLAEAIRAGGAGIGGFFTPAGAGTEMAAGETRIIDGRPFLFVSALRAEVAFIRASVADTAGNLIYRMTEQNFNRAMATAARTVIAEVEKVVPVGTLDPNQIHTPGCFVDYLVQAHTSRQELGSSASVKQSRKGKSHVRLQMAACALEELRPGEVVNLGIGIPTLVADLIRPHHGLILHTENGMLGVGPSPEQGGALDYPVNAGKIPVTALPGTSYFDSSDSFAMIRGGHVDVAIMGGLQVDQEGSLANWAVPGKPLLGVGGAMDLASGAKRLIVTMTHTSRDGRSKIVPRCTLPLTASGCVDTIITELALFRFREGRLTLNRLMPGVDLEKVAARTDAKYAIDLDQSGSRGA